MPAAHSLHVALPVPLANDPGQHALHVLLDVAPTTSEAVPSGHSTSPPSATPSHPAKLQYVPAAHGVHAVASAFENVPAGHATQSPVPELGATEPASHA